MPGPGLEAIRGRLRREAEPFPKLLLPPVGRRIPARGLMTGLQEQCLPRRSRRMNFLNGRQSAPPTTSSPPPKSRRRPERAPSIQSQVRFGAACNEAAAQGSRATGMRTVRRGPAGSSQGTDDRRRALCRWTQAPRLRPASKRAFRLRSFAAATFLRPSCTKRPHSECLAKPGVGPGFEVQVDPRAIPTKRSLGRVWPAPNRVVESRQSRTGLRRPYGLRCAPVAVP